MKDLIDRQAVINAIENTDCELPSDAWDELTDAIMSVPSAQPERKTGRWVDYPIADGFLQCSVCGILRLGDASNFCPNCGAKMEDTDGN